MVTDNDLDQRRSESQHLKAERLRVAIIVDDIARDRSIDDITVVEISSAAELNKTQFYRLFDNKYEVCNWYLRRTILLGKARIGRNYTWRDGVIVTMGGCLLLPNLMASSFKVNGYYAMRKLAKRLHKADFEETIMTWKKKPVTELLRFEIDFYLHAEDHMNKEWFLSKDREPVEDFADKLVACVPRDLYTLLDKPVEPHAPQQMTLASLAR